MANPDRLEHPEQPNNIHEMSERMNNLPQMERWVRDMMRRTEKRAPTYILNNGAGGRLHAKMEIDANAKLDKRYKDYRLRLRNSLRTVRKQKVKTLRDKRRQQEKEAELLGLLQGGSATEGNSAAEGNETDTTSKPAANEDTTNCYVAKPEWQPSTRDRRPETLQTFNPKWHLDHTRVQPEFLRERKRKIEEQESEKNRSIHPTPSPSKRKCCV